MGDVSRFLKKNKEKKANVEYVATKSLTDEKGVPLKWTLRALTSKEIGAMRDKCTIDTPVRGKRGQYTTKLDEWSLATRMAVASVVFPDLKSAELQDSYGVKGEEDLLQEMIDNPGEYGNFISFVNELSGYTGDEGDEDLEFVKN